MPRAIPGIHHVTAVCGTPQANFDFYTGVLGQRLVKKTVNFDSPDTYHLYYGDYTGSPGTILTFFPFVGIGPGRAGPGMASAIAYAVPKGELDIWTMRLAGHAAELHERFGARVLAVADPDGMQVELVESATSIPREDRGCAEGPSAGATPLHHGFHSVTLWLTEPTRTGRILTELFGYESYEHETRNGVERMRFRSPAGERGSVIDLVRSDVLSVGRPGAGTIHHVAFRAEDEAVQHEWRERVEAVGLDVTPVIDRQYFKAIYFREPGGVLIEIATDPPGFATDEVPGQLGRDLKLPPQYEDRRSDIERALPPLRIPA